MTERPDLERPDWVPPESPPVQQPIPPSFPPGSAMPNVPPPDPTARRTTNGFAIASLIFGALGGVLGLIFGIIALVQIRRRGAKGRGLAITGICLWATWVAVGITAVVIEGVSTVKRDSSGQIAERGSVPLSDLKAGDCFDGIEEGKEASKVTGIPCGEPHDAQLLAVESLPDGRFPGDDQITRVAEEHCHANVGRRLMQSRYADQADLYYFQPSRTSWRLGDRDVYCIARGTTDQLNFFIQLPPLDPAKKEWAELRPGDCIKDASNTLRLTVTTVPCTKPHAVQIISRFKLPDGPWPGESTVDTRGDSGCSDRVGAYFDKHPPPMDLDSVVVTPNPDSWSQGDRLVLCGVKATKGKLTRSLMTK